MLHGFPMSYEDNLMLLSFLLGETPQDCWLFKKPTWNSMSNKGASSPRLDLKIQTLKSSPKAQNSSKAFHSMVCGKAAYYESLEP